MSANLVYVCQKTFSNIIIIIVITGAIVLVVQVLKTRFYIKKHLNQRVAIPDKLKIIASDLNLDGKINVVKDENKLSFCYGIFSPKVCMSTGLIKALTADELKAVLLHESYHVKNHDPLKIILGQTASSMLFFIPILKEMQRYFVLSKEIAADNMAVKYGDRRSFIAVLNKLLTFPAPYFNGIANLASLDNLEKRILYLTDNQKKVIFRPSLGSVLLSIIITLFSLMIVNVPVYTVSAHENVILCRAEKEINYTRNLLYTPMTTKP